ncbi:hypothetical protein MOQ_008538 [Trypanosoma cruzi marinkellei]|uniref:Dispersed gene family protein 1 (DGF-1) n=1 Tax=Trypanosoma cruzi marinkellei TaxID=85056 RepID=K2MKQ7_TRYCR|nr:hypothetical protein MOQ_008538 [Trypanosoma cruzi marinkellei]
MASMLFMTSISASYLWVTNSQNVMYLPPRNGTAELAAVLMIPEYNVEIGMLYFTIGASSFSRRTWNLLPLQPLSNTMNLIDSILPEDLRVAYLKVKNDALQFGYAAAESCGGASATTIMHKSRFVIAASSIGALCGMGMVFVALGFLFHLRKIYTSPCTKFHVERKDRMVRLTGGKRELGEFIELQRAEKHRERRAIIALIILSVLGTTFLVTAEAFENNLRSSTMKCGRSFCGVYEDAMRSLFQSPWTSGGRFSCQVGYSSVVLLAGTVLTSVLFILIMFLSALHFFVSHANVTLTCNAVGDEKQLELNGQRNPMEAPYLPLEPVNGEEDKMNSIFSAATCAVTVVGSNEERELDRLHQGRLLPTGMAAMEVAGSLNGLKRVHY